MNRYIIVRDTGDEFEKISIPFSTLEEAQKYIKGIGKTFGTLIIIQIVE